MRLLQKRHAIDSGQTDNCDLRATISGREVLRQRKSGGKAHREKRTLSCNLQKAEREREDRELEKRACRLSIKKSTEL